MSINSDTNLNRNPSFLTKILAFIVGQPIITFTTLFDAHFGSFRILFAISARKDSSRAVVVTFRIQFSEPYIKTGITQTTNLYNSPCRGLKSP